VSSAVSLRDERADTPISLALEFGFVLAPFRFSSRASSPFFVRWGSISVDIGWPCGS
jgi:hypothetical protein